MILPGKHTKISKSILNVGSILLESLNNKQTISLLWDKTRPNPKIQSFERFTLGLDLLFTLGLVDFDNQGIIKKVRK